MRPIGRALTRIVPGPMLGAHRRDAYESEPNRPSSRLGNSELSGSLQLGASCPDQRSPADPEIKAYDERIPPRFRDDRRHGITSAPFVVISSFKRLRRLASAPPDAASKPLRH